MNRQWYRMGEGNVENRGAIYIGQDRDEQTEADARSWNKRGFGIFWTVNDVGGDTRRIEKLIRINAWAVDIDAGEKAEQQRRIERCPLHPSMIVETKRGYQVYWHAKDGQAAHWNAIVLDRLVPYFGADKNARDLARILRAPGFMHLKDPVNQFRIALVYEKHVSYTEQQIASKFPDAGKPARDADAQRKAMRATRADRKIDGDTFWDRVFNLDCEEALLRLSGHAAVHGEVYTFKRTGRGNLNILVDGRGTSCWIDSNKRIGSLADGGPSIFQWLSYFGNSPRQIADALKQVFPNLEEKR